MPEPTGPAYHDRRAPEYDDWYLGAGPYAGRERCGFDDELAEVIGVSCGASAGAHARRRVRHRLPHATPQWLRHRPRRQRSDARDRLASSRRRNVRAGRRVRPPIRGRQLRSGAQRTRLRSPDDGQRVAFLAEARRVAPELVLVDASRANSDVAEEWSERYLLDGSRWEVYKRWFGPAKLLAELGGGAGDVLHAGHWFVIVRSLR